MAEHESFLSISIQDNYDTDYDNIIECFYNVLLPLTSSYSRGVGYFSTNSLLHACQGVYGLVQNNGRMRLVVGAPLTLEEFSVIKDANSTELLMDRCLAVLDRIIFECTSDYLDANLKLFSYLLRTGRLELKFALKKVGMYHEKIGIFEDGNHNKIAFSGSANETGFALTGTANSESIIVFKSNDKEIYSKFGSKIEGKFTSLWSDQIPNVKVVSPNDVFVDAISDISKGIADGYFAELFLWYVRDSIDHICLTPKKPAFISGKKYELRPHQLRALSSWKDNNFCGIFSMATGSGKTYTALHAAVSLYEQLNGGIFFVVAVPYVSLAEQWSSEMAKFGMNPLLCFSGKSNWLFDLNMAVNDFSLSKDKKFISVIVVNATFESDGFQELLNRVDINRLLFVADECHHHSSEKYKNLIPACKFKMALSATPWNDEESDHAINIKKHYGNVIAEYSIDDALKDKVLCPYKYRIINCEMNEDEANEYLALSSRIGKIEAIKESGGGYNEQALMHLYLKRSRLLGAISSKLYHLNALLKNTGVVKRSLFYCGEGADFSFNEETECVSSIINRVSHVLSTHGYKSSRFTSDETSSQRMQILDAFKNEQIDALVSKRVLDEGIDIPACEFAFILASTTSLRQYVQRRGRVLRKYPGKDYAIIYDFVVTPPKGKEGQNCFSTLIDRESNRVHEFKRLAIDFEVMNAE